MENFLLYFSCSLAVISIIFMLFSRVVFHAALWLILCLISLAGIYLTLGAEFMAATQIMVYAGGVVVLIIFGIMLTARRPAPSGLSHQNLLAGILLCAAFFSFLVFSFIHQPVAESLSTQAYPISTIGQTLFTIYVGPFETAGILLLVSLIGATVMVTFRTSQKTS
jgi:NADH:ubiquinone oxidoreductase subunit 6 (subunit J)